MSAAHYSPGLVGGLMDLRSILPETFESWTRVAVDQLQSRMMDQHAPDCLSLLEVLVRQWSQVSLEREGRLAAEAEAAREREAKLVAQRMCVAAEVERALERESRVTAQRMHVASKAAPTRDRGTRVVTKRLHVSAMDGFGAPQTLTKLVQTSNEVLSHARNISFPIPAVQRLPAVGGPADLTNLNWGPSRVVDSEQSNYPSCLALDSNRLIVNWQRPPYPYSRYMTAVRLNPWKASGPFVSTGYNDTVQNIHERRLAPFGPSQCVVADRDAHDHLVGRVATVAGLIVSLMAPTELGSPCGTESDLYRLDNGLYVVSGRGLCGHSDYPSLVVFRVSYDGFVAVLGRAEVSQTSPRMSFLVGRSVNRVGLAHEDGLDVYDIRSDGTVSDAAHVAVPGMERGDWYRGLGVDLGRGRVAQLWWSATHPTILAVDLRQPIPTVTVRTFRPPEPTSGPRRACCAGGYLIIPGKGVLDVFNARSDTLASWQHVKRYTLKDLWNSGFPCVVDQHLVLVYSSTPPSEKLILQLGRKK